MNQIRRMVWASAYGHAFADMVGSVMPLAYVDVAERAVSVANIAMSNYDLLESRGPSEEGVYDPNSIPDWEDTCKSCVHFNAPSSCGQWHGPCDETESCSRFEVRR